MHLLSAIATTLALGLAAAAPASADPTLLAAAGTTAADPVPLIAWEEVSRRPHDTGAFTQGLLLDPDGRLFESTGLRGQSSLREVEPTTGEVLRIAASPAGLFAEGLARVDDELIQLTWQAGIAWRHDLDTFELLGTHAYAGEGWGLCYDGEHLVMSDGSERLTFRDPQTFEVVGSVAVVVDGAPLRRLNELECVDGSVWANVWYTDAIVRIDPADGEVEGVLDLRGLIEPHPADADAGAVLNGIAYDAEADTFLVTGKHWPEMIEIRLSEGPADSS